MLGSSAAALVALASMVGFLLLWRSGTQEIVDARWFPLVGSRLRLALDPLAAPLAVFATGVAAPILSYAGGYMPKGTRLFYVVMLAFMASMVLLVLAQDLLVVFAALELSAGASFLLIRHGRTDEAERAGAVALTVTLGSSLLFVAGVLWIAATAGTTVIAEIPPAQVPRGAAVLLVLGVIAKSAQVPFHFWLPRAMVAPTPVSAYLHSAALVAAGAFVLMRVRPLLSSAPEALVLVLIVGFASIAVGGTMALVGDDLKRILAYSTIAQLGHAMVIIGASGEDAVSAAAFFIVAHGLAKSALFMTAGAVTRATGEERLSELGGLARRLPALAVVSGIAAAALAGLPLTIGYFKDELFFGAAARHGPSASALATLAAAITLAYVARFWIGIFARRDARSEVTARPGVSILAPIAVVAGAVVICGLLPRWAGDGFGITLRYGLEPKAELWMALAAWGIGAGILIARPLWEDGLERVAGVVAWALGPAQWADRLARACARASDVLHELELRDLRDRVGAVMLPSAVLVGIVVIAHGLPAPPGPALAWDDAPVVAGLIVTGGAALAAARPREHLVLVLQISFVGLGLAFVFAVSGQPNLALVILVVETMFTLLFLAVLRHLRRDVERRAVESKRHTRHGLWIGICSAAGAFVAAYVTLSAEPADTVAWEHVRLAPEAHAKDVVTAILADFRGLDTVGELTVLAIAVLGAAAVSWGVKR